MNLGTAWDDVSCHFDPVYAQSHGYPTIFVKMMHLAGCADRMAVEGAGPRGRVVGKWHETSRCLVDLEIAIDNLHGGICCPAESTIDLTS